MVRSAAVGLEPQTVALLRGGARAAVTVAVLALHLRGAAGAGRPGTMRASGASAGAGLPLEKAVHASLYRPAGMRELLERPRVRRTLAELRTEAAAAGLLRRFPPHRTRTARRALKQLRAGLPLPADRAGLSTDDLLLAVALYGDAALTVLAARFAEAAGLIGRGGVAEHGQSWGGGGGIGFTDDGAGWGGGGPH
ncbi:TIGR04222 domain-containing membrane protein [Streptomyces sp. NPDC050564]|uniref:TIGR04222 domain-containing membrane protein n=1 Tax=Streptomyces sp. NPDC050564 TaxID=3365631 RepID=UPI0037B25E02